MTMLLRYTGEDCFSFVVGKIYESKEIHDNLGDAYAVFDEGYDWYRYSVRFVEENFEIVAEDEQEFSRAV